MKSEYEQQITASIMKTFSFKFSGEMNQWVKCATCGKLLMVNYYGKLLNERMIDHAKTHSATGILAAN